MGEQDKAAMVHRAYSVIVREGQDPFWHEIGATFAQRDGKGLTLILQSLPLEGRIVLRNLDAVPKGRRDERNTSDDRGERADRDDDRGGERRRDQGSGYRGSHQRR